MTAVLFLASAVVLMGVLLPGAGWLAGIGFATMVVLVANALGVVKVAFINKKNAMLLGVLGVAFAWLVGSMAFVPGLPTPTALMASLGGAAVTPYTPYTPAGPAAIPTSECMASVSPEIRGTAATITVYPKDFASNSPGSTTCATTVMYYRNGNYVGKVGCNGGTSCTASITNVAVGDSLTFYGDGKNASCYIVPKTVCIDTQAKTVDLEAYTLGVDYAPQMPGNSFSSSCYDDTGGTACSTGTNTTNPGEEDWDITMGANEETAFYIKLKVNAANKAFRLGGVATYAGGDIDECYPAAGFTSVAVPKFLKSTVYLANSSIGGVGTPNVTTSGWESLYAINTPVLLNEWDSVKYQFIIKSGTTDPTTTVSTMTGTASDICAFVFLDSGYAQDTNSAMVDGLYQRDAGEANIGVAENVSMTVGQDLSGVIEGI